MILFEVTFRLLGKAHSGIAIVWAEDEADAIVQVRKLARKHDRDFAVVPKASSIAPERGIVYEHSGGCC